MLVAKYTAEPKMAFNFARTCKLHMLSAACGGALRAACRLGRLPAAPLRLARCMRAPASGGLPAPKNCHIFDAFVPHILAQRPCNLCADAVRNRVQRRSIMNMRGARELSLTHHCLMHSFAATHCVHRLCFSSWATAIGKWGRNHFPTRRECHHSGDPGLRCCSTSSSTAASLLASSSRRAGRRC